MTGLIVAVVVAVIAVMCSQVFVPMSSPISTPRSTPARNGVYTCHLLFINYLWIEEYMYVHTQHVLLRWFLAWLTDLRDIFFLPYIQPGLL